jgi:hypothetical protein
MADSGTGIPGMTSVILWTGDLWFKLVPGLVRENQRKTISIQ